MAFRYIPINNLLQPTLMILTKEEKLLRNALIVMLFLFLSLITHFFPGLEGDNQCWQGWAKQNVHGLYDAYKHHNNNYMPFYQYVLYVYGILAGSDGTIYSNINYIRIATIFFDFIGLWYVYQWIGRKVDFCLILLLSMLNFSYAYNTITWGQVDGILATFVFASVYYAHKGRMVPGAFFFILAVNMKLQAIIFLPVFGLLWLCAFAEARNARIIALPLLTIILTQFMLLIPFMVGNSLDEVWGVAFNSMDYFPKISMNAFNLWYWFVERPYDSLDTDIFIAGMPYKQVGLLLFCASSFLALLPLLIITLKKLRYSNTPLHPSQQLIWSTCGLISLLFFFTNTQMHERYVHPAFIFLTASAFSRRAWLPYILFSIAYFLNLEAILRSFNLPKYTTLVFDPKFIAALFAAIILTLFYQLFRDAKQIFVQAVTGES